MVVGRVSPRKTGAFFDILNPGSAPGVTTAGVDHFNTEATGFDFSEGEITLTLPSKAEVDAANNLSTGDACLDNCQKQMQTRMTNCKLLRQRVELMLKRAGCPSKVIGDYSSHSPCVMPERHLRGCKRVRNW